MVRMGEIFRPLTLSKKLVAPYVTALTSNGRSATCIHHADQII